MRWACNIACGLSMLLFTGTAALWLRSFWPDELHIHNRDGRVALAFVEGLRARHFGPNPEPGVDLEEELKSARADARHDQSFPGLEFFDGPNPNPLPVASGPPSWVRDRVPGEYRVIVISHVYPLTLLGAASAWLVYAIRHRRRPFRAGHCAACGYDLRATPDRCPECGTVPVDEYRNRTTDGTEREDRLRRPGRPATLPPSTT
jgi:hypothetical protein